MATGAGRDPVNEAYDRASELVEAAAAIGRLARDPGVALAAPSILACVETALGELADASAMLGDVVDDAAAPGAGGPHAARLQASCHRMARGYANLERGLRETRDLASATRALTVRVMARARLDGSGLSLLS